MPRYEAMLYPWLDPSDRSALATAILYWDRVYTIVPESVSEPYQGKASKTAHDFGFLRPEFVCQDCDAVRTASQEFLEDIDRDAIKVDRNSNIENEFHVHPEKVSRLLESFLTKSNPLSNKGLLSVGYGFGTAYMSRLAAILAREKKLTLLSDRITSSNVVSDSYTNWKTPHSVDNNEWLLAQLAVETIGLPNNVRISDIWIFKEKHSDIVNRYRSAIRALARSVTAINDGEELLKELNRIINDEIKPGISEIEARLREKQIEVWKPLLRISMAGFLGWAAAGFEPTLLSTIPAIGDGVWELYTWRKKIGQLPINDFAYLFAAKSELACRKTR